MKPEKTISNSELRDWICLCSKYGDSAGLLVNYTGNSGECFGMLRRGMVFL